MTFWWVMALGILSLCAQPGEAAIYVSTGPDGTAFYTDAPPRPDFQPLPAFGLPPSVDIVRGQYADLIDQIAAQHAVDPQLVRAIIRVESNFEPLAISRKGAQGLMQLMPATAGRFAVGNPFDPAENIRGGVRYLRTLLDMFPGKLSLALAAYNAGENAVLKHRGIPPYRETQDYVARVLKHLDRRDVGTLTASAAPRPEALPAAPAPRAAVYRTVDADGTPRYSNVAPLVRPGAQ
ncbi:MAG: lytic transglycosylase domain-containing protein [Candidatus Methylomirabilales bacterium]